MKASQALDVGSIPITRSIIIGTVMLLSAGCAAPEKYRRVSELPAVGTFAWPIRGAVTAVYGSKKDGVTLKGILITPDRDPEILASQDGTVGLVENLKGYGKTIILEHDGGFSSVYAGCSKLMVRAGQLVRRGDKIALSPSLYFEIRRSARAEDPIRYLQKKD